MGPASPDRASAVSVGVSDNPPYAPSVYGPPSVGPRSPTSFFSSSSTPPPLARQPRQPTLQPATDCLSTNRAFSIRTLTRTRPGTTQSPPNTIQTASTAPVISPFPAQKKPWLRSTSIGLFRISTKMQAPEPVLGRHFHTLPISYCAELPGSLSSSLIGSVDGD